MAEESLGVVTPEAPVVTPVAAPEATPAPDTTAVEGEAPEGAEPKAAPERTFTQDEMNKVISKRIAQESRRLERVARAEAEAAHYKQQFEALQKPQQQPRDGEPRIEDFQKEGKTYEEFIDARMAHQLKQERARWEHETQAQQQQRQAMEQASAVRERLKPAESKYADFKEVALADEVPITQPMAAFIAARDKGGDVAYYLGSNLDEAHRIANLHPVEQVLALRDLESKISAAPAPTRTPAPIVPNGTNARTTLEYKPSMSDKDFDEWYARQRPKKRR